MDDAQETFDTLRGILAEHEDRLTVDRDDPEAYALEAGYAQRWDRVLPFGSVEILKSYVSYHLFPVYVFPDLLDELSSGLRARMQGKSCFNFRTVTESQRRELETLTRKGLRRFAAEGLLP